MIGSPYQRPLAIGRKFPERQNGGSVADKAFACRWFLPLFVKLISQFALPFARPAEENSRINPPPLKPDSLR
jgi:hypothetical protein